MKNRSARRPYKSSLAGPSPARSRRLSPALAALALATALCGCAMPSGTGPYSPQSEAARDSLKAQKLTQEAAGIIDKDPARAEKLLREALTADLYHGPAHNNLGVLELKHGHLYEAASEFEWAKKLLPGLADPRLNLALTLEKAGRTEPALAAYRSALEVEPAHLPSLEGLARLQLRSGHKDERTRPALEEIAFRESDPRWRDWARLHLAKMGP